jgi:hypothetical protein
MDEEEEEAKNVHLATRHHPWKTSESAVSQGKCYLNISEMMSPLQNFANFLFPFQTGHFFFGNVQKVEVFVPMMGISLRLRNILWRHEELREEGPGDRNLFRCIGGSIFLLLLLLLFPHYKKDTPTGQKILIFFFKRKKSSFLAREINFFLSPIVTNMTQEAGIVVSINPINDSTSIYPGKLLDELELNSLRLIPCFWIHPNPRVLSLNKENNIIVCVS